MTDKSRSKTLESTYNPSSLLEDIYLPIKDKEQAKVGNLFYSLFGDNPPEIGEFRPCFIYHEALDWLEYLEEDCCTVTEYQNGTNIAILRKWDGEKYCGIVGIKIEGFSEVAPPGVVEAYKTYNKNQYETYKRKVSEQNMCVECGRFLADPPSSLCPGCEAYQEHTR